MNKRTSLLTLVVLSLLLMALSACAAQMVEAPDRMVEISTEAALSAQTSLFSGLATGQVMLNESEFSSYVTKSIEANSGPNQPIESVIIWIEPDSLHFRVVLKEGGIMLPGGGNTLDLIGQLVIADNQIQVDLMQAGSGAFMVSGAMLDPISAQINAVLAQQIPMLPIDINISQDTGMLSFSVG